MMIGKKEIKMPLFIDNMTLHIANPYKSMKKFLELIIIVRLQDTQFFSQLLYHIPAMNKGT